MLFIQYRLNTIKTGIVIYTLTHNHWIGLTVRMSKKNYILLPRHLIKYTDNTSMVAISNVHYYLIVGTVAQIWIITQSQQGDFESHGYSCNTVGRVQPDSIS